MRNSGLLVTLLAVASCNGILGIDEASEISGDASLGGSSSGGTGGVGNGGGKGGTAGTAGSTGGVSGNGAMGGASGGGSGGVPSDGGDASDADASCGANLQTDDKNCGACGHDCLGGQCLAGNCQPVKLGNIPYGANDLSLGPNDVFVVSGFGWALHKVAKAGGTVSNWGTSSALVQIQEFQGVLYFNEYSAQTIYKQPSVGALLPQDFYYGNAVIDSLAVDASGVYFAQCAGISTGVMRHLPLAGGTSPATLNSAATIACPEQLVLDATSIYYTSVYNPAGLFKMPKTGGVVTTLTTATDDTWGIAIAGPELYYSTVDGDVFTIHTNGTGKQLLSGGFNGPGQLLVDGGYLYVTARGTIGADYADGAIYRMQLGSSTPVVEPIAEGIAQPTGIAADATAIYWSNRGVAPNGQGAIWKLAK